MSDRHDRQTKAEAAELVGGQRTPSLPAARGSLRSLCPTFVGARKSMADEEQAQVEN